jgi:hypothetical protein
MKSITKTSSMKFALNLTQGLILGGLTLLSTQSFANQTTFEKVSQLYNNGTMLSQNQARGWNSGRCYHADAPNHPIAGLLVGLDDQSNGPIENQFKILVLTYDNISADYYDNMNSETVAKTERSIQGYKSLMSPAYTFENSLSSDLNTGNARYQTRISQNYLTVKIARREARNNKPANSTIYSCYFFKKVK